MLELGHREHHLFGGIFAQILLVGLLVFAYTQAIRQLNHGREMFTRLQEQLTVARDQMARRPAIPDLAALKAEVGKLKEAFASEADLAAQQSRLERVSREVFNLTGIQIRKTDSPVDSLVFSVEGRSDLEIQLYGLELTGQGNSREVAGLLSVLSGSGQRPMLALATVDLRAVELDSPVAFTLRWLIPVLEGGADHAAGSPPAADTIQWGVREEPFLSPLRHRSALRAPAGQGPALRLTGILWDPSEPACVINKRVLKPGEWVESFQVILITPTAVILQGLDEERVLYLS
ncbi:MAG: hypothetical protein HYZ88_00465 [Candidatus Omnitrophica bacterium]|nr:hypothetical protein [Candidatus Omnitrophota bacterium]